MNPLLKEKLVSVVGTAHVIDDPQLYGPYSDDFTDHYECKPLAVVRPGSSEEVAQVLRLCAEYATPVVTQGGNTSLTGAAVTYRPDREIILSTTRMKKLIAVDTETDTMIVEAGMTLAQVHEQAEAAGRFFPLSFAAEGNATIGGCAACNAGGVAVLRYGTTRDLILGVEVVLPDGRIYNGLRQLRKDNTGYDFKDLFVGSEGTLGVITKAVLKLFPIPSDKETAWISLESAESAVKLLALAKKQAGSSLSAFELIHRGPVERVRTHLPDIEVPQVSDSEWKVLMELSPEQKSEESVLERILEEAFEAGMISDAALASTVADAKVFWHVRESIPLADRTAGGSIHSDISLPISSIPAFVASASQKLSAAYPWLGLSVYGHLGDGNLHFNFVSPEDPQATYRHEAGIRDILYSEVNAFEGSISAEHGIGMLKLEHNYQFKDPLEIEMMQKIKKAFDPQGLLNPGKLLKA